MSKHTPEPWMVGSHGSVISTPINGITIKSDVEYYGGHMICESITKPNARRIVTCVNACAEMEDPAAEIAELKRKLDEMLGLIKCVAYHSIPVTVSGVKRAAFPWSEYDAIVNKVNGGAE